MKAVETGSPAWLQWLRRNERRLAVGYLTGVGLLFAAVALAPARRLVMSGAQSAVKWWDERWTRRLAQGERLVTAGRFEEAATYLARLDRVHPATDVRHGRDKERERLLRLLAQSYEATGHGSRAMETYHRLAAFDSLNYRNYFFLAQGADRLLSGWAEAPEAKDAFATALRLLPSHLPSLRGYVDYYMDRGEFRPVVESYETYLDAHLVQEVGVRIGESQVAVPLLVDGRSHDLEIPLGSGPVPAGQFLEIATAGFGFSIDRAVAVSAQRVGRDGSGRSVPLDLSRIELALMERAEHSAFRGLDSASTVRIPLPALPDGVARIDVRVAIYKPIDRALWMIMVKSYNNLLNSQRLADASARTVTQATPEAADRVLSRLRWAREGLGVRPDERPF